MAAEAYFSTFSSILLVLIFVAFSLALLYLVYCEGKSTSKAHVESKGSRRERSKS